MVWGSVNYRPMFTQDCRDLVAYPITQTDHDIINCRKRGFTKYPNHMFGRFKPSTATVWIALYSHAWMRDGARPSIGTVMEQTRLGRTAVKSAIRELVAAGELTVTPRGKAQPNLYGFPNAAKEGEFAYTEFDNRWECLGLTPRQVVVLLAIRHFSTLTLGAVPGGRELASMTKVGRNSINDDVAPSLERLGVLRVDQRLRGKKRKSNTYVITPFDDLWGDSFMAVMAEPADTESAPMALCATAQGTECDPQWHRARPSRSTGCDPYGAEGDPLMALGATTKKPEDNKTDQKKPDQKKPDREPPRLRRAAEEGRTPDALGKECSGTTRKSMASPGIKGLEAMLRKHGVMETEKPADASGTSGTSTSLSYGRSRSEEVLAH